MKALLTSMYVEIHDHACNGRTHWKKLELPSKTDPAITGVLLLRLANLQPYYTMYALLAGLPVERYVTQQWNMEQDALGWTQLLHGQVMKG
jgi:hypothetical protein